MENDQDSPKSSGVCEKILHAFSFHPNKNTKIRHVSHNHVGKPVDHVQTKHPNSPKVSEFLGADQIPIKLDYSSPKVASEVEEKQHHVVKVEPHVQKEAGKQPAQDINDTFSDYIKRAKMKIRSVSNAGGGKNIASQQDDIVHDHHDTKKRDTSDDHFSEYINRAKMKIRTVSNAGGGKNIASQQDDIAHDHHDTKKRDTSNDHFSEFINRAKMKIRSVSNAGGGKIVSFKRE